ncbi:hypothetical protein [Roseibium aggregatum]|uniref:Uncharacterized protein n=1 Tax=Roseibium aggregatum TaxID=187304 RepID=A0A926NZ93_9HYPH|nr:hypothetical protein [Roseibium aggregatum]MBD1546365.1 hypothetical protein [Roseibium aggregatum]
MSRLLLLGDIYVQQLNGVSVRYQFSEIPEDRELDIDVLCVGGVTPQGAVNPNASFDGMDIFKEKLMDLEEGKYDYVGLMLGEVDCGFVFWYHAEKSNVSIFEQLDRSLKNYEKFITTYILPKYHPEQVCIFGSVLPTIPDDTEKKYLKGARAEVNATQYQRTALTLVYNGRLQSLARKLGVYYIDITVETMDFGRGLLSEAFANPDPANHLLDEGRAAPLLADRIVNDWVSREDFRNNF